MESIFGEISDKTLVHKVRQENVFVTNLRRAIPVFLSLSEMNRLRLCLGEYDRQLLETAFIESNIPDSFIFRDCQECIPVTEIREAFRKNNLTINDLKFLNRFYKKNGISGRYCLKSIMDESETIRLRRSFSLKHYHLSDMEKVALSNLLYENGVNFPKDVFYGSMVIDTNHFFFFEHPQDHVPGMMLIETIRQMLIAICHKFGSVPLDYNFILSEINFKFSNYIELYLPVLIKVELTRVKKYDSGIWGEIEFEINVFQNSQVSCSSFFKGSIISQKVFQRIRKNHIKPLIGHPWFVLRDNLKYSFIVKSSEGKTGLQILYLSLDGCIVKYELSNNQTEFGTVIEFYVYFNDIGLLQGTADCIKVKKERDLVLLHLKFRHLENEDKNNLQQVIRQFGYLAENNLGGS